MTIRLSVLYNQPTDPAAFLSYYEQTHAPLAKTFPDLSSFTWGKCLPGPDGSDPAYFLTAELVWETPEKMQAAFGSEQGQKIAGDVANFATGGATMVVAEGH